MSDSICLLCLQKKKLLKKSHVIPDFMYQDIFDEDHKLYKLAPSSYVKGDRRIQRPSSGEYDSDMLCKSCDNEVIGSYESYGRRVLYAKSNESPNDPIPEHGITEYGIPVTRFTNVDYKRFKLFLLSILWRASVSKRSYFRDIALGPYEHEIRKMILDGNPRRVDDFPIILMSWAMDDSFSHKYIAEPSKNRTTKGIRYVFIIAGMTYLFHVSPNSVEPELMPFTILPTNSLSVLYVPKGMGKQLFESYFNM